MSEKLELKNPLVSVIIPAYNAERFVEQAVRSIMTQTYKNLEIIICDDCSTDGTLGILEKLTAEDGRIVLLQNENNSGIVNTLNRMVGVAKGKYIARMDADDISLPERIEKQIDFLEESPQVSFCGCNANHIDENGNVIGKSSLPLKFQDVKFFLPFYPTFYHPAVMAQAKVFKQNPYSNDFLHAEDYELWCRLVFNKGLVGVNLEKRYFKYRINTQGISIQNLRNQKEIAATISGSINSYQNKLLFKNIFFLNDAPISKSEFSELKLIKKKLCSKRIKFSIIVYQKILFHLWKFRQLYFFTNMLLCPLGIYSISKIVLTRLKKIIKKETP